MPVAPESPDQPDVLALIDALDAYQRPLYPPESHHGIDLAALLAPNVHFIVARDESGAALGCGAIVLHEDYAELKRMFVLPAFRGQGLGRSILAQLERAAVAAGCPCVRLETGVLQSQALAMYGAAGYERRGPFADYVEDPHSVYMEKPTGVG